MAPRASLFDPTAERDACGIGFVADVTSRASREITDLVVARPVVDGGELRRLLARWDEAVEHEGTLGGSSGEEPAVEAVG